MALGTGRSTVQRVGKRENRVQLGIELSQLLAQLSLPVMAVVLLRASWPVDYRISQSQKLEGG
jgi:hypothetical protein